MPYVKSIRIYTEQGINNCTDYVEDRGKTSISENTKEPSYLSNAIGYAANEDKTSIDKNNSSIRELLDDDVDVLVSGYRCNVATVESDFKRVRTDYYTQKKENLVENKKARSAYHFIQSFDPHYEIDPRLVHQIGLELLSRLEHYQGTVNTHMNTEHIHNHIIMNAFSCDGPFKWRDNMESLQMIRNISDEISLKYGVPIILNPVKGKGISYTEWKNIKEGTSWKQQIRNDITSTMQVCTSWTEFVQIMKAAGYDIRETENSVTYVLPSDTNKRVREKKLGHEYTKAALIEFWNNYIEQNEVKHNVINPANQIKVKKKKVNIYVSRYTASGRKRTDLELVLLIAIKIIKVVGDSFRSEEVAKLQPTNPINKLASWKLTQMTDSLHLLQSLGINSKEELKELLNKTGAELSHMKKEVAELENQIGNSEHILTAINEVEELKIFVTSIGLEDKELMLPDVSEKEIRINKAAISPLTAKQRRDLFIALSDSDTYRLKCDFNELTNEEGKAILNFLNGKTINKPSMIVSLEEYNRYTQERKYEKIRQQKAENLKKKYDGIPLSEPQKKIITLLGRKKVANLDLNSLTYYDGLMIVSYLKSENPFEGKLISKEQIAELEKILTKNKFLINRATHTVTEKEYYEVLNYFSEKGKALPDLLKPSHKITASVVAQLKELLEYRKISIPFDVEELSVVDSNKLYSYLLFKDVVPECLSDKNPKTNTQEHYDALFQSRLLDYPEEYCDAIVKYRSAVSTIKSVGIDIDSISEERDKIMELKEELIRAKGTEEVLGQNYYKYSRLNYNLGLAENKSFTYGGLYEKSLQDIEITEIEELANVDNEVLTEDTVIDKEGTDEIFATKDDYFSNVENFDY